MTDEFMGRLNPPTAQRIAPMTLGAVGNAVAMVAQGGEEVSDLSPGFEGGGLHAFQAPPHFASLAQKQPGHRRLDPLQSLLGVLRVLCSCHPVKVLRAVIIVQDFASGGKEFFDPQPNPVRSIGHYTQPDLSFGNQLRFFDLAERGKQLRLVLNLMPAQNVDDPLVGHQVEAKAFGLALLALPAGPLGPRLFAAGPAALRTLRPGGHMGPIDSQYHNGPAAFPSRHRGHLGINLLAGGRHLQPLPLLLPPHWSRCEPSARLPARLSAPPTAHRLSRKAPRPSASPRLAAGRTACAPAPHPRRHPSVRTPAHKVRSKNTAGPARPSPPQSPACDSPRPGRLSYAHSADRGQCAFAAQPSTAAPAGLSSSCPSAPAAAPTPHGSVAPRLVWPPSPSPPGHQANNPRTHAAAGGARPAACPHAPRPTR